MRDHVIRKGLSKDVEVQNLAIYTKFGDPSTYEEAAGSCKWKKTMECEIQGIERNKTWSLTTLPTSARSIGVKWI